MKLSELIVQAQAAEKQFGDMDIIIWNDDIYQYQTIDTALVKINDTLSGFSFVLNEIEV